MTGLLVIIFGCAALSLISYVYCWQDIMGGKPHIISLRSITTIMDRNVLNQYYGRPDEGWRYHFPPATLKSFIARWRGQFYQAVAADVACLLGVYRYMGEGAPDRLLPLFILLAGGYQAISYAWSYRQVRRWGHQIREEMDDPDD